VPSGPVAVTALFERGDTVTCYVWVTQGSVSATTLPAAAPTHVLVFPFDPFATCSSNDTVYMYSHCTTPTGIDFMGTTAQIVTSPSLDPFGAITSFACPPNLGDPTQMFNLCMANSQSTTGFLLDQTLDPLALVGVYDHTSSAQAASIEQGRDARQVVRERGELWDEFQAKARAA
jgi:hypothetical protein